MKNPTLLLYLRLFLCLMVAGTCLYFYIEKENELLQLRLTIPVMEKEARRLEEENKRLQYEIEIFESPVHLMQLLRQPEFGYLKYPQKQEIIRIE